MRVGLGCPTWARNQKLSAGRGPRFPVFRGLGGSRRATTGWATGGTQSEDTAEVHLQTLRPLCGRRETTAAHISVAWASPGQEAELAVV